MAHGITKYLNPSPATAKGHMKRLHQSIRSTHRSVPTNATQVPPIIPGVQIEQEFNIANTNDNDSEDSIQLDCPMSNANLI
jgi:hypothetical protein